MPLFDFDCRACGRRFERLVRPQDGPPSCPSCGSGDLHKLPSSFAPSSENLRRAAASKATSKAAKIGRLENAAFEREIEHHRLKGD
jgi:putative FmdB family regulatory protein